MFNNNLLMAGAAATAASTVSVGNSALFVEGNNENLSRTPLTAGNRDTWTFSTWVYRTLANAEEVIFNAGADDNNRTCLKFNNNNLQYFHFDGGGVTDVVTSNSVYRDSGWIHVVCAVDTTQAAENNRVIIYVNGSRVSSLSATNYPAQNTDTDVNSTETHYIGCSPSGSNDLDAYLAETVLIDGTQLAPTSFGEFDSTGLYWTPKSSDDIKALTFGTNGFYLSNATDISSGMTTFVDSGPTGHTITTGGNTTHSPLGHKVQNSVIYVDGTTDYISVAPSGHSDFTFGTGDWCIEGWFLRKALSGTSNISYIFDFRYASNDDDRPYAYIDGSNDIQWGMDNSGNKITSSSSISLNTWFNLAIARSSGTTTMYLNGSSVGSWSDSTDYAVGRPWFFEYPQSNAYCLNGYATELRISKGAARYTGNFTPSTTAFASDSSTSLLVHSNKDFGAANDDTGDGNNFVNNNTVEKSLHTPTNMQALWNPNFKNSTAGSPTLTNGNKTIQVSSTSEVRTGQNLLIPTAGKWIMGVSQTAADDLGKAFGIWTTLTQTTGFPSVTGLGGWHVSTSTNAYQCDGTHIVNITTAVGTPQAADQFWICADVDNSKIFFGFWDNSASSITWYASDGDGDGNPVSGANPSQSIDVGGATFGGTGYNDKTFTLVEEADIPFTIPTGYKFLTTENIASATTRTASDTDKYFKTVLYEGNGTTQRVGNFQPFTDSFTVGKSALFANANQESLSRGSMGSTATTWTFSCWVKRCEPSLGGTAANFVFTIATDSGLSFGDGSTADVLSWYSGSYSSTTEVYGGSASWIHLCFASNSGTGTLYVNGTSVKTSLTVNGADATMSIGAYNAASNWFDGYIAEVVFIDGTALTPSSFGQTDTSTNRWVPKSVTGLTYGTNGFYLDFSNGSDLGEDQKNSNDFTNNNTVVQTTDSPTTNYSILDGAYMYSGYSNGNLTMSGYASSSSNSSTIGVSSGKWYCELTCGSTVGSPMLGVVPFDQRNKSQYPGQSANGIGWDGGTLYRNNATLISSYGSAFSNGEVNAIMLDLDNNQVTFRQANTAKATVDLNTPQGTTYYFYFRNGGASSANDATVNFGESDFTYTIPTGYSKLSQDNITSSDQYISAFSWIKNRDATDNHMLFDRVRGVTKDLHSNQNHVEVTNVNTLQQFLAGGVQVGNDVEVNTASESYALWNWMIETTGGGTANEDGSINTTATLVDTNLGLSISKYTGTGSNATVGHGLGVAPEFIMIKNLEETYSWLCYHSGLGNTKAIFLDLANGADTNSVYFNDTSPTSSVFSIGTTEQCNKSSIDYIAYCFAPSQFISVGSFTGNENTDGPFVPTINSAGVPIQPAWIMIKNTVQSRSWIMWDKARSPYNVSENILEADTTTAEQTGSTFYIDIDTGGFKIRGSHEMLNGAETMIYLAMGTPIIDTDGRILAGR